MADDIIIQSSWRSLALNSAYEIRGYPSFRHQNVMFAQVSLPADTPGGDTCMICNQHNVNFVRLDSKDGAIFKISRKLINIYSVYIIN
jgi:hypothetical protein